MAILLYDVLQRVGSCDLISVYTENNYGQYIEVFEGKRDDGVFDEDEELFWHSTSKVIGIHARGDKLYITIEADEMDKRAEELYLPKYVEKWKRDDPSTRPYLNAIEYYRMLDG